MSGVSDNHVPVAETGSGLYKRMSGQGEECIVSNKDRILDVVDMIPVQQGNNGNYAFTICDYATADGSGSMHLIKDIISRIRKKHEDVPVQVIYEDQASNDFNRVFKRVHGLMPDSYTYLNDFSNVFAMATGAEFHSQVLPENTADLIMCFWAMHWLTEVPTTYRNSLTHRGGTEAERKLAAAQAAKDWERFLLLRAKELKSGGVLIVSMGTRKAGVRPGFSVLMEVMARTLKSMESDGRITEEEFVNTNFHFYERNSDEIKAPFEDRNSAVSQAGLKLISYEEVLPQDLTFKCWQDRLIEEGVDDRLTFATEAVDRHKYWSASCFIQGLSSTRSQSEKEALVDEINGRLEAELSTHDPREFSDYNLIGYTFVQKVLM